MIIGSDEGGLRGFEWCRLVLFSCCVEKRSDSILSENRGVVSHAFLPASFIELSSTLLDVD